MYYTEEQIEEVRSKSDIVQIIGRYVNLKRTGSSYVGLCPFHSEKSPSFNVSPSRQMYKCFGCGVAGNVITFIMEYENYTFPEAMEFLAEQAGVTISKSELSPEMKREKNLRTELVQINAKAASYYYAKLKSPAGKTGYEYFLSRGLSEETIRHFGLGYAGQGGSELYRYLKSQGYADQVLKETGLFKMDERGVYDKFWNRVMFPIMDINNRVIGFGGRVMGDAKPKYLNSPETKLFNKSKNLFGLNYAKLGKKKNIILCEGYMDVIAMHQAGFTNAVASLGTAFTSEQAVILRRYTDEVLLTYDSDQAGVKAALRAIPMLRDAGINARIVHMEPYKDPDEFIKGLGSEEFEKRMAEAQNAFLFEIDVLRKSYDISDPEQKTKFDHEMAAKLLVFEDKVQRDNYIETLSAKYSIKKEDLRGLVIKSANRIPANKGNANVHSEGYNRNIKKVKESGIEHSYKLLLSWLADEPNLFDDVSKIINKDDFEEEPYRKAAALLYEQFENGEVIPARIINHFEEADEQKAIADIFQTTFKVKMEKDDMEKALNEIVYKIKKYSIDKKLKNMTDINNLQNLMIEKNKLQNREKMHISLKDG
ncbi:MAG: DNA primase [Clostridium sp.]|uniref:DNA primase n=1 Tax=Butyribacter sp. TaxID=2822465 RepID=UPI002A9D673A|nr:DNA primase [Clostridium sp.]MDY5180030.1 DNA primase [Butyribacter sp.]